MKQLGILDAAFINLEQTNTPQHVGGLGIYDPSTAPGGFVRFKDVISSFERRLGKLPLFRTRIVEVPGGLDRPYWVKDGNFDVEFHLRHIALPAPGDWRQLCIQVARLHSRPLDMSRPLWEAYIIEGLDNIPNLPAGCFAVYTKMHHALVDGAGGSSFMAALHDLRPDPGDDDDAAEEPRLVDADPGMAELLSRASINGVKNTLQLVRGTARNTIAIGKYALDVYREQIPAPDVSAPKTSFNRAVGPHRVFDAAEFPLDGFKAIKNATGVTLNDVALGVIGGALQRYLQGKGEAPAEGSLAAAIPLNMRTRRDMTADNNQVGSVFASLHTDIEDPIERLQAIKQSTAEAKASGEASPMVDAMKLAGVFSPLVSKALAGFWARNELSRFIPMNVSTCISNVPGPDFPLYCAGARMVDYYGLGVLTPGMGIFHLVFSYSGKVTLSVLADRDIMPDPEHYHDLLVASYQEVYRAALSTKTAGARPATDLEAVSPKRDPGKNTAVDPAVSTRPKRRRKPPAKAKAGFRATPKGARPLPEAKTAKKTPGKGPRAKARPRSAAASR
ncbi:MAG: wax ester/triacylglycerol synthase family O-acyltransferase [Halioglobus sp.]|nr:wax ester/triacylglycerol synthase family O-acyltransferase [Halioglobus sp.]MBP6725257.1 wax ester/triacylglycerol synthase family O-acyltransferase [Halioglobus sp.]